MKSLGIAAAVAAGIAIGVSCIAVAHEDHDKDSGSESTRFTAATPVLNVGSVEASIQHYTSVLGFKKDWDWPAEAEDKTFASISNGEVNIFLAENGQGARPVWIYYSVGDVDKLHEAYTAAGADIKQKPVDQPWGAREMLVADKDGHILRIGGSPPVRVRKSTVRVRKSTVRVRKSTVRVRKNAVRVRKNTVRVRKNTVRPRKGTIRASSRRVKKGIVEFLSPLLRDRPVAPTKTRHPRMAIAGPCR